MTTIKNKTMCSLQKWLRKRNVTFDSRALATLVVVDINLSLKNKETKKTMYSISKELQCVIETKDGPVLGYIDKTGQREHYKFQSIPYAKPPVGQLRFLPPCPIQPWSEILDCTKPTPVPFSLNVKRGIIGSEDCLYLEVTSPCIKPEKPLPVMFWIGSYCFGLLMEEYFDTSMITEREVIFVKCGFRLGAFGFLSINDISAPGNCGLKDIIMALKWVQRNIDKFGGDPSNITLFGSSSGGAIVHLMMLSPMAKGLFHKAIIQSASALNNWSLAKNPIQPAKDLATGLGLPAECEVEVVEQLRNIPAEDIMRVYNDLESTIYNSSERDSVDSVFKPCIEHEFEGQQAFLIKSPLAIIKSGKFNKVPLIIGSNNIEATLLQFIKQDFYNDVDKYNDNLHLIVPKSLSGEVKISKSIGQQLLKFYLDGEDCLSQDTRPQYLQLMTDYYYLYYIYKTVQLHSQYAPECPIYYYVLNHAGEWAVPTELICFNTLGHSAEIPFIFGIKMPGTSNICKGSKDSVKTRNRIIKMWTNFAKYGNPTPDDTDSLLQIQWDPVESKDKIHYLHIGSELTKGKNPFSERMEFWDKLHKDYKFLRALAYFNDLGVIW